MKIAAFLCAAIFIITLAIAVLIMNIEYRAFDSQIYINTIASESKYDEFKALILKGLINSNDDPNSQFKLFTEQLPAQLVEPLINIAMPTGDFKGIMDEIIVQTIEFISFQKDSVVATLPVDKIKENLGSAEAVEAFNGFLSKQSKCNLDQLETLQRYGFLSPEHGFISCNPPGTYTNSRGTIEFKTFVVDQLTKITSTDFPKSITLIESSTKTEGLRENVKLVRKYARISWIIPALFLLALSLLVVRSPDDLLIWWGWSILIAGILVTLLGRAGGPFISSLLSRLLIDKFATISIMTFSMATDILKALIPTLINPMFSQGLVLIGVGLSMLVGAYILSKRLIQKPMSNDR